MILVDSSVWIEYFRGSNIFVKEKLEYLIDTNLVCVNDIILAELIPPLVIRKQNRLIEVMKMITKLPMNIMWDEIVEMQVYNIKKGLNNVGIPDLLIVQNILQNNTVLFTLDKHFSVMRKHFKFDVYK